jgi:hypothetical protein
MQFIGITGHRGSGKTSVGYLLGNTLNAIRKGSEKEDIEIMFNDWCYTIKANENAIYDCPLYYVYFDEFGEMPKSFVAQLLSIDMSVLDNDTLKDTMYVNMKDFKLYSKDQSFKIITSVDILNGSKRWKDCYISLREFAKVFSIDIMQKFFGTDVWLKSRVVNDEKWQVSSTEGFKVFSDVKTKDEIKYIKDRDGIIIRTCRLSHKKQHDGISNTENADADFIIDTEGCLYDLFDKIYNIANKIYEITR